MDKIFSNSFVQLSKVLTTRVATAFTTNPFLSNKSSSFPSPQSVSFFTNGAAATKPLLPFASGINQSDTNLIQMRTYAVNLLQAMDSPSHPCNPLSTPNTSITKTDVVSQPNGGSLYTMWMFDGKTTCCMQMTHNSNNSAQFLAGNFLTKFYVSTYKNSLNFKPEDMAVINLPDKKTLDKYQVGQAAYQMMSESIGEDFFQNTLPGPYSGFFVSEGYNAVLTSGGGSFTWNVRRVVLKRTDMAQASPFDQTAQNKVEIYVQAEPNTSEDAFKVIYIDVNNNGTKPEAYGSLSQPSFIKNWLNFKKSSE